jgi:hypothetical protein
VNTSKLPVLIWLEPHLTGLDTVRRLPYNRGGRMGFKEVRTLLVDALRSDQFEFEDREDIDGKNLLAAEKVNAEFVIQLLLRCDGREYECRKHHTLPRVLVHVFTPLLGGERWYVKAYFVSSRAVFISVHR